MKCYRKNGSDGVAPVDARDHAAPSMKCYRKNGSDMRNSMTFPSCLIPQ